MRLLGPAAFAMVLISPVPALAQDIGPALEMGPITGEAAASHLQQSEERRARGMRGPVRSQDRGSQARSNCARKGDFSARFGVDDPRVQQLYRLCKAAGY